MSETTMPEVEFCEPVFENEVFEEFVNPTSDNPVRVQDVLPYLNIEFLESTLSQMYGETWRFHFKPKAMIKFILYWKLSNHRFLKQAWNSLVASPDLADTLGFEGAIPSYQTFYHFFKYRLDKEGVKTLFDAFLAQVKLHYDVCGRRLGQNSMIDSTPIEKKNAKDATYSPKYGFKGYKWHNFRDLTTCIPLDYHVTTMSEYDGNFLAPMVLRAQLKNIKIDRIWADCHYATRKNFVRMKEFYGIQMYSKIAKDWDVHHTGSGIMALRKKYQKYWKEDGFNPNATIEEMKWFLIERDQDELIGYFYRDQIVKEYQRDEQWYMDKYGMRNRIEHNHGTEKRQSELRECHVENIDSMEIHVGLHCIALLAMALVRLQHGISEGLVNLGGLA